MIVQPADVSGGRSGSMEEQPTPGAAGPAERLAPDPRGAVARRRVERDRWLRRLQLQRQLHDGASLGISAIVPRLGVVRTRLRDGAPVLDEAIDGIQDQLHAVLQQLREVAREIYPPLLEEAGLGPALHEFAERIAVPVRVVADAERFHPSVEGAAYFAVADCLDGLPPGAPSVEVSLRRDGDVLVVVVTGVPVQQAGAMLDQVCGLGGWVGTAGTATITAGIPCG
jgi:signal transduction histidine kinase